MVNLLFTHYNKILNSIKVLLRLSSKDDINFYYFVINLYLNCEFISNENKNNLQYFKLIIEKNNKDFYLKRINQLKKKI